MNIVNELQKQIKERLMERMVLEKELENLQQARNLLVELSENGKTTRKKPAKPKAEAKPKKQPKKAKRAGRPMKRGDLKRAVEQAMTRLKSAHLEQITSLSSKYAAKKLPKASVNATLSEGKGKLFAHDKRKGKGYWRYVG